MAGIQLGALWYARLFGLGFLRLLMAIPALFATVKILGAMYLAWPGAQMIWKAIRKDGRQPKVSEHAAAFGSRFNENSS